MSDSFKQFVSNPWTKMFWALTAAAGILLYAFIADFVSELKSTLRAQSEDLGKMKISLAVQDSQMQSQAIGIHDMRVQIEGVKQSLSEIRKRRTGE